VEFLPTPSGQYPLLFPFYFANGDNMTERQINIAIAAVIILAVVGFGAYQFSLAYPRNHLRANQYDRCELLVGWKFRWDSTARLFCGLNDMEALERWAKRDTEMP
jgi:hypothetical protein